MTARTITDLVLASPPLLRREQPVGEAVRVVLDSGMPALPVVDDATERFAGIFGEREFMEALFPGWLKELKHAAFLPRSLEDALEKRTESRTEPVGRYMNTEHVEVGEDFSDSQVAEIFLHHRVLVIPVVGEDARVSGIVTRRDFFRALAERYLDQG